MPQPGRLVSGFVWAACLVVRWLQTQFCHPFARWLMDTVLSSWEETFTSFIREVFSALTRYVNDFFSWVMSAIVDRSYSNTIRAISRRTRAWQGWWSEDHTSTFNAIIASEGSGRDGREVHGRAARSESSKGIQFHSAW
jgi:hypothetical protein